MIFNETLLIMFIMKIFRIFFTLNPNLGSISRAMRNRGVEITVTKETDWFHNEDETNLREVLNCHAIDNASSTQILSNIGMYVYTYVCTHCTQHNILTLARSWSLDS